MHASIQMLSDKPHWGSKLLLQAQAYIKHFNIIVQRKTDTETKAYDSSVHHEWELGFK